MLQKSASCNEFSFPSVSDDKYLTQKGAGIV